MPNQVHGVLVHVAMSSGSELSRVRTELLTVLNRRILTGTIHATSRRQPESQPSRRPIASTLGNASVSTHRQVKVPMSPFWMNACCCLGCFHQQEAQQAELPCLLTCPQPFACQHWSLHSESSPRRCRSALPRSNRVGVPMKSTHRRSAVSWTHTGMSHQSQRLEAASWLPARPLRLTLQSSDSCDRADPATLAGVDWPLGSQRRLLQSGSAPVR